MRFGAWCALFALAIQFSLAFGHVHGLGSSAGAFPRAVTSDPADAAVAPDAPAGPVKPAGLAFDYCAICAVINLTGNGVPAGAPGLVVAFAIDPIPLFWPDVAAATAAPPHRLFQARAPPLA